MTFKLSIKGYQYGDVISQKHTCDGQDISPALEWADPPASTKSFALVLEDPDAPKCTFTHWIIYNIPPNAKELPEGINIGETTENKESQGLNDFGNYGYNGPCPPGRQVHRYFFYLYALIEKPELPPKLRIKELKAILETKMIKQASYMLKYGRHYEQEK